MTTNIFSSLNLSHNPFTLATSREGFYQTESTRRILDELSHGIETRKGVMVLIGEVGVGKTSLSLQILSALEEKNISFAWVFNTVFTKEELFRAIVDDFGLSCERDASLLEYQNQLHRFFLERYEAGRTCVIVVDEAHNLSDESLESLRMLTNFESGGQKLVQVLLIGQPELGMKLNRPHMRQLRSRVAIFLSLPQLDREELVGYVNYKLAEAGSQIRLEGKGAALLWEATRGNLRQAKLIMERVLYGCVAFGAASITPRVMKAAILEIRESISSVTTPKESRTPIGLALGLGLGTVLLSCLLFIPFWSLEGQRMSAAEVVLGGVESSESRNSRTVSSSAAAEGSGRVDSDLQTVARSLEAYLHKDLAEALTRAVDLDLPELLVRELPEGVSMLMLDRLPAEPGSSSEWKAVAWRKFSSSGPTWLVFWEPDISSDSLVPGQRSAAVLDVQQSLFDHGVLFSALDGVFGAKTWFAVSRFQKKAGLSPTGQPDLPTLFFLRFWETTSPAH
jgi:type II secretory pathway predicted ATPase ExeA